HMEPCDRKSCVHTPGKDKPHSLNFPLPAHPVGLMHRVWYDSRDNSIYKIFRNIPAYPLARA
ncbi:hypothetical protein LI211_15815, partial [Erysipelatoclostridium ramosum]|uniref:hypothetical protein n=1 Tax=Thomasclavelia ramosa TaxID=1547 RepID=UPI001D07E453